MPGAKLQSEQEFTRWWNEGRSYQWIIDQYREKYDLDITPSAIGNWRARLGLERRQSRNIALIPWTVLAEHRYKHAAAMLRAEGRRREGQELSPLQLARLNNWLRFLQDEDVVVHYDPETEEGFFYVPRRPDIDKDIVREPGRVTRARGRRE